MKIQNRSRNWESKGTVINNILNNDEICLEVNKNSVKDDILETQNGYRVELINQSISYKRMERGVKRFVNNEMSISSHLYYKILGNHNHNDQHSNFIQNLKNIKFSKNMSAPNLPELNVY